MKFAHRLLAAGFLLALGTACAEPFERGVASTDKDNDTPPAAVTDPTDNGGSDISYTSNVYPALQAGCSCHKGSGIGSFKISGDAAADYAAIATLITPGDADASLLLTKGQLANMGGTAFAKDSDNYAAIAEWISDGAPNN